MHHLAKTLTGLTATRGEKTGIRLNVQDIYKKMMGSNGFTCPDIDIKYQLKDSNGGAISQEGTGTLKGLEDGLTVQYGSGDGKCKEQTDMILAIFGDYQVIL